MERIFRDAARDKHASIKEAAEEALQNLDSWRQRAKKETTSIPTAREMRARTQKVRKKADSMPGQSLSSLIDFLRHEWPAVRKAAAEELGKRGGKRAVAALIEALRQETDIFCLQPIITGLKNCAPNAQTLELLGIGLQKTDSIEQSKAALALAILGFREAVPFLIQYMHGDEPLLRVKAILILVEIGVEDAIGAVINALLHGEKMLKGSDDFDQRAAEDWDETIHRAIEQSGAQLRIMGLLREALQDQDQAVRWRAARELAKWESPMPQTITLLKQALQDQDATVRMAALRSIGSLKESGPQAINILREALQDPNSEVREAAVEELGLQQQQLVEQVLIEVALSDTDEIVRKRAASMLRWFDGDTAVTQLIRELQGTDSVRQIAAIEALRLIEDEAAIGPLVTLLNVGQSEIRIAATRSLIGMQDDTALNLVVQTLTVALKDDRSDLRVAAAGLLIEVTNTGEAAYDAALQVLAEAAQDANRGVREIAAQALMGFLDGIDILWAPLEEAYATRDYARMLKQTEELLSFRPGYSKFSWFWSYLYVFRSKAHFGLDQYERALADIEQALERLNYLEETHIWHAHVLGRLGRNEEALTAARQAAELKPNDAYVQTDVGWWAYKAGHYQDGIIALQRALELEPKLTVAAFNLGLTFLAARQMDNARDAYQHAIKTCEQQDEGAAYAVFEDALTDLEELARSRLDLVSSIEEFKQVLKIAQTSFQVDDPARFDTNDSEETSQT